MIWLIVINSFKNSVDYIKRLILALLKCVYNFFVLVSGLVYSIIEI